MDSKYALSVDSTLSVLSTTNHKNHKKKAFLKKHFPEWGSLGKFFLHAFYYPTKMFPQIINCLIKPSKSKQQWQQQNDPGLWHE